MNKKPEVKLNEYNNSWYDPGAGNLKRVFWFATNILFFKSGWHMGSGWKRFLLKLYGARVGEGVVIKPGVNIKYPWNLEIGNYVWIGEKAWIDNLGKVTLCDNVCLSQDCLLLCGNHDYSSSAFDLRVGDIYLENGVWIGARATVGPGVRVGQNAVLAVGSVASSNLEPGKIYRGNPAVPVKERIIS